MRRSPPTPPSRPASETPSSPGSTARDSSPPRRSPGSRIRTSSSTTSSRGLRRPASQTSRSVPSRDHERSARIPRLRRPSRRPRGRRVADGAPGGEGYGHCRRPPRAPALRVIRLPTRGWTARSRRRCTEEKVESCHSCASSRRGSRGRLCSTSTRRRFFWAMMLLQSQQAEVGVG
ncbi:Succinate--CoA ligase [ADP-forming] subunit beta mitochondrial [Zea mays]|uniref:Succinate--CoA ligase [ADP-forming] subunit beta mitochondrial n=1 Tax=Zea mays TaxID=4577 RepID=A0A1D6LTA5_MAIZE|nr:Succinate--CoA ligase [ADP-forming] subunit beta mitochondrial [Zea mays]AQK82648.1 Succinate--CoA ligase [ADP-forming] subunit beta mitochondrial [Zea mays]AQK82656.1 Succinate--CoA ligase [ADP-forming] subunit beta mitochondrial [Zea mays]